MWIFYRPAQQLYSLGWHHLTGQTAEEVSRRARKMRTDRGGCRQQRRTDPGKSPLWLNLLFSLVYRKSLPNVPKMDKAFFADEKCTACRICANLCPARNIVMAEGKPAWQHQCEQCFACLQWCPEEAIQYGKNTKSKKRYHDPEISLKDIIGCVPAKNSQEKTKRRFPVLNSDTGMFQKAHLRVLRQSKANRILLKGGLPQRTLT